DVVEWCDRRLLARIHRRTLDGLRRLIEPVSAAALIRFLLSWQHVRPGTQQHGRDGLLRVIERLEGFEAAAGAWERELLTARVADYERRLLDELCLAGEVAWGRFAVVPGVEEAPRRRNAPTRNAPVTLALREDLAWLLAGIGGAPVPLGPSAQALVDVLGRRGASFLPDLAQATARLPAEVEQALWELVSAGLVTCDGFSGLRTLVDPPARGRIVRRSGFAGGRWSLLRAPGPDVPPPAADAGADDAILEKLADQYLRRYGVVFRDLLARESAPPPWRDLLRVYRALEARGAIRGGRFVAGFTGEQFALPEAVEALRAARRAPREGAERIDVSAADPLNLVGILTPGARVPAVLGNRVAFVDGVPAEAGAQGARSAPAKAS
ncbi:MAG TPA: DEAD/DEAH box helicase, partial [Anaeromyxobacter sp.]